VAGEGALVRNVVARQEIGPRPGGAATDAGTGTGRPGSDGIPGDLGGAAIRRSGEEVIGRGLLAGHGGGLRTERWGGESAMETDVGARWLDAGWATKLLNDKL